MKLYYKAPLATIFALESFRENLSSQFEPSHCCLYEYYVFPSYNMAGNLAFLYGSFIFELGQRGLDENSYL